MADRGPVRKPFAISSTLSNLSTVQYNHWPPPRKGPTESNLVPTYPLHHQYFGEVWYTRRIANTVVDPEEME